MGDSIDRQLNDVGAQGVRLIWWVFRFVVVAIVITAIIGVGVSFATEIWDFSSNLFS